MATREELRQQLASVESEIAELQAELAQGPPLAIRNAIEGELSMLQARAASLRQQIAAMGPKSFAMVDDELPAVADAPLAIEVNAAAAATPAAKAVARPRKRPSPTKVAATKVAAKKAVAKKAPKPKPRKRTAAKAKAKASKRVK